jgi:hypothetical protein
VTDGQTCHLSIGRVCVKSKLHVKIHFYVLSLVITVGWHGIAKGEVDFYGRRGAQVRIGLNWMGGLNSNVGHIQVKRGAHGSKGGMYISKEGTYLSKRGELGSRF